MSDVPSIKELQKLRVVDLKERLSKLGASTSGLKADLVARLHETLTELSENEPNEDSQDVPEAEEEDEKPNLTEEGTSFEPIDPEKILLDQQKEALALEQVRLLEEEKDRQDKELIERGKHQQQLLEGQEAGLKQEEMLMVETQQHMIAQLDVERTEKGKQQQMLIEQQQEQERIMVETQQIMLAQEEHKTETTLLAEQQQIIQQQQFVPLAEPLLPFLPVQCKQESAMILEPIQIPQVVMMPKTDILRSRIPHSGPQTTIAMNPLMTMAGMSTTPVTTMAGPTYVTPRILLASTEAQLSHVLPTLITSTSLTAVPTIVTRPELISQGLAEVPMVSQAIISPVGLVVQPQIPLIAEALERSPMNAPLMTMMEVNEPLLPLPISQPQSVMMQPPPMIPSTMHIPPNSLLPIPSQAMSEGLSSAPLLPLPTQVSIPDLPLLPNPPNEMPLLPLPQAGPIQTGLLHTPPQPGLLQTPPPNFGSNQGLLPVPDHRQGPITSQSFDGSMLQRNQEMNQRNFERDQMIRMERGGQGDNQGAFDENEDVPYHLPSAIEKVLALQTERAQDLDAQKKADEENIQVVKEVVPIRSLVAVDEEEDEMEEEDAQSTPAQTSKQPKESKNKRRKEKKKRARQRRQLQKEQEEQREDSEHRGKEKDDLVDVEIDYVPDTMEPKDPLYFQFLRIFEKFKLVDPDKQKEELSEEKLKELARQEEIMARLAERKKPADIDEKDDDDEDDKKEEEKPKISKRKLKKLNRMSVAELKQKVGRPELVEMHDVTAKDPILLLHLKAARNSVPVPRHWCFKRKYLQGKRGIEKPPFNLPEFIKKTGIMEMRQALQEKEEQKTMKAKMRERVRPKMGKIDIDYQKLHDAFFKWQIKPRMTIHGDLYYEGKEFETRLKEKKPGELSEDLRMALGMPVGPNQQKCPPPWLIAMQRYGPPPSYPNLKIPGLNAPIPEGCSFGYHAGGWGKPPVDEMGRPLYGDVFGTQLGDGQLSMLDEEVDRSLWGELESESSEESEEESEEEDEEEKAEDETGLVTPAEGLVTPSGLSSVPTGMETPDMIELRKRKIEAEMEGGETPALYTILPEKQMEKVGASMMGSTHIYDMTAAMPAAKARGVTGAIAAMMPPQGVEVTLDPSELEMDSAAMAARYEQTVREQQSQLAKEDLSDMVAEHAARQKNKRKKQQQDTGKTSKKYKEFKF